MNDKQMTLEKMGTHTVEKIGGTSMISYQAIRDNIFLNPSLKGTLYQRIFVVSAYGGVTDQLLEHKKSGQPGIYGLFASGMEDASWFEKFAALQQYLLEMNERLFGRGDLLQEANAFLQQRLDDARKCLQDLQSLCRHGHFALDRHLATVREMLASIGEAHSAWNTVQLLRREGINACFVDLTGWGAGQHVSLDERIQQAFETIDLNSQLPVVTGYAHSDSGLMSSYDRGYSEITFSRIAVLTRAREAIIHKEFHLSSADPKLVGAGNAIPIGRTNYDVTDQLANLGMEAIHPKAAKGLRQKAIPLRIKNTFEPDHAGTTITRDYVSATPCVEIVAGSRGIFALEVFDQDMVGDIDLYDREILALLRRFKVQIVAKDINANTITHYLATNLKTMKRLTRALQETHPDAEFNQRKAAIVSAIGSDMKVAGILSQAVAALAENDISVLAVHQSMRQVDMQFIVDEDDYELAIQSLHRCLIEVHGQRRVICAA